MAESDSDGIDNLLGDIDDLDDQLFGKKKEKKKRPAKKGLGNLDDLFGDTAKTSQPRRNLSDLLASTAKRPVVSFLDDLPESSSKRQESKRSALDSALEGGESRKPSLENPPGKAILLSQSPPKSAISSSVPSALSTVNPEQPTSSMESIFGPLPRRGAGSRTKAPSTVPDAGVSQPAAPEVRSTSRPSDLLSFLSSAEETPAPRAAHPSSPRTIASSSEIYDRTERLEREINRLNQEVDELKRKKKEDEEELITEWRQKLSKRQQEQETALEELKTLNRKQIERMQGECDETILRMKENFDRQLQSLVSVQKESSSYEAVVLKVENLTDQIGHITSSVASMTDKSVLDRETAVTLKEQQLVLREERLADEKEKLALERKAVNELTFKLQSMCESNEQTVLEQKWQIKEERNKLNAERAAFKHDQKYILDMIERRKLETDNARTTFLREQHDLLVRVVSEKAMLDDEKNAFAAQRDADVARLKGEAQRLDENFEQVANTQKLLENLRRMYEAKYQQLVELEETLVGECLELEQCRKQMEFSNANRQGDSIDSNDKRWASNFEPFEGFPAEVVADPFDDTKFKQRNENVKSKLKMHAEMLDRYINDDNRPPEEAACH